MRRELPELPPEQVLLEPVGRNTAPAIGWSLASMPPAKRSDVVVSLHSDHWIEDEDSFRATLEAAVTAAAERRTVIALGVRPRWAETGYGYLEVEEPISLAGARDALHRVVRFREKPDAATAAAFVEGGRHLWNAGIFVFPGELLLDRLRRFEPAIADAVSAAAADPARLDAIYPTVPAMPIDTAVMERLDELSTMVLDCGWSDLGSWEALAEVLADERRGRQRRHAGKPSRSTRATTCCGPTTAWWPCSVSRGSPSCSRATPCWWCPRSDRRKCGAWSRSSRAGARTICSEARRVMITPLAQLDGGPRALAELSSSSALDRERSLGGPCRRGRLEIEIGFGKGRYLLARAAAEPDTTFLGIESAALYWAETTRRAERRGLGNLITLCGDALYLLAARLERESADAVHVYFPDPWPKTRHHRRRLLDPSTVDLVVGVLAPGAALYFATDHADYGAAVLRGARPLSSGRGRARGRPWPDGARTHYETKYEQRRTADPPAGGDAAGAGRGLAASSGRRRFDRGRLARAGASPTGVLTGR